MAEETKRNLLSPVADIGRGAAARAGAVAAYSGTLIASLFWFLMFGVFVFVLVSLLGCVASLLPGGDQCSVGDFLGNSVLFGGRLVQLAASFFEFGLRRVVLTGDWLQQGHAFGIGIGIVWRIIRDVVNLVLIGGLVWAAISMILKTGQGVGKIIVQIIIAAILVNFSYFFTGAIIDASNFTSKIIFEESFGVQIERKFNLSSGYVISERFMTATRLNGLIYGDPDVSDIGDFGTMMLFVIIALILFATTAWIFMAMGGLFLQRFIVIVILLITSPIGMLAFTDIPRGKELGQGWWAALYSQALFPPVMLLGVAASIKVLEEASLAVLGGGQSEYAILTLFKDPATSVAGLGAWAATWDLVLIYIIGIAMLFLSMKIATGIAKQEPLKVPTTGQFYGAYRGAAKQASQVVQGAAKFVGGLPTFSSRYRNLGDFLTQGPQRRNITWPDAAGQRSSRAFNRATAAWQEAWNEHAADLAKLREAEKSGDKDAIAAARAKAAQSGDKAAIAWHQVPSEDWKRQQLAQSHGPTDEEKKLGITRQDKEDALANANALAAEGSISAILSRQQTNAGATSGGKEINAKLTGLLNETKGQRGDRTRRAMQERKLEYLDQAKEKKNAETMVNALRTNGRNAESQVQHLPGDVLKHPNVRIQINGHELIEIGRRKDISTEEWNDIAGGASDEARETFEKHAPRRIKQKRPLPPKTVTVEPEKTPEPPENSQTT